MEQDVNKQVSQGEQHELAPWDTLDSRIEGDYKIFTLNAIRKRSPRNGVVATYYALDTLDWVNVIAITPENMVVMVEQYRHATNTIELELPGGMMNKGETDPIAAAMRELREETGYDGSETRLLASCYANPAILTNRFHTVMAWGCVEKYPLDWDSGEDMRIRLVPEKELDNLVSSGAIRHSVMVAALHYYSLFKDKK